MGLRRLPSEPCCQSFACVLTCRRPPTPPPARYAPLTYAPPHPSSFLLPQEKLLGTLLAGYAVWVPYNFIAFRFIPQDLRLLAGNLVGIAWGTFVSVSCINSQAPSGGSSGGGAAGMTAPAAACSVAAAAAAAGVAQGPQDSS